MFTIMKRRELNPTVTELWIKAPLIAKKAKAGQFIIVRAKEDSERIPLTIAGFDREAGTVSIIFQVVGAGTMQLNALKESSQPKKSLPKPVLVSSCLWANSTCG